MANQFRAHWAKPTDLLSIPPIIGGDVVQRALAHPHPSSLLDRILGLGSPLRGRRRQTYASYPLLPQTAHLS